MTVGLAVPGVVYCRLFQNEWRCHWEPGDWYRPSYLVIPLADLESWEGLLKIEFLTIQEFVVKVGAVPVNLKRERWTELVRFVTHLGVVIGF